MCRPRERDLFQLDDVQAVGARGAFRIVDGASRDERHRRLLTGERDRDRVSKMAVRSRGRHGKR